MQRSSPDQIWIGRFAARWHDRQYDRVHDLSVTAVSDAAANAIKVEPELGAVSLMPSGPT